MQRLILFLIAIVLFGIAGFALIWFGAGRDLQGPSVAFLTLARDGDFEGVAARMHPDALPRWDAQGTERLWTWWGKTYGDFGEVVRRIGVSPWEGGGEGAELLTLDLGFRGGHVVGWFYFRQHEGRSKLVHVALKPRARVDVAATERTRLDVTARKLFDYLDGDDVLAFYDALHPELQMQTDITAVAVREAAVRDTLGARTGVTLVKHASDDATETQHYRLDHERGARALRVVHRHEDGRWWVVEVAAD